MEKSVYAQTLRNDYLYKRLRSELSELPAETTRIMTMLIQHPRWFEIGKTLNSFEITEKVTRFKLEERLRQYMRTNKMSVLELVRELGKLEDEGFIHPKNESPRNYYSSLDFAEAVDALQVLEENFVSPLTKELEKNKAFGEYKNPEQSLFWLIKCALEE